MDGSSGIGMPMTNEYRFCWWLLLFLFTRIIIIIIIIIVVVVGNKTTTKTSHPLPLPLLYKESFCNDWRKDEEEVVVGAALLLLLYHEPYYCCYVAMVATQNKLYIATYLYPFHYTQVVIHIADN
jgi:hypothetical protein